MRSKTGSSAKDEMLAKKAALKELMRKGGRKADDVDDRLTLDPQNANRGTARGAEMVRRSLKRLGAGRSVLASADGVVIAGNQTLKAARRAGIPVRMVDTDGSELVVVRRTDLEYADPKARELAVADNRTAQVGLEWDPAVLGEVPQEALEGYFAPGEVEALTMGAEQALRDAGGEAPPPESGGRYAAQGPVLPGELDDDGSAPDPRVRRVTTSEEAAGDLDIDNPENEEGDESDEGSGEDDGIYALREDALFPSANPYGIPDLLPEMLADESAIPNRTWSATGEEDGPKGTKGMVMLYGTNALPAACKGAVLAFYLDDWRFEAAWNDAVSVMEKLKGKGFAAVIAPDFSVWRDDPAAIQIFNIYRSRWCARYWQEVGIKVIPSLNWADERSYEFAHAGIPTGAPVVSVQCRTTKSRRGKAFFAKGLVHAIQKSQPGTVLMYGGATHRDWIERYLPTKTKGGPVKYVWLVDFTTARKRRLKELRDAKK